MGPVWEGEVPLPPSTESSGPRKETSVFADPFQVTDRGGLWVHTQCGEAGTTVLQKPQTPGAGHKVLTPEMMWRSGCLEFLQTREEAHLDTTPEQSKAPSSGPGGGGMEKQPGGIGSIPLGPSHPCCFCGLGGNQPWEL